MMWPFRRKKPHVEERQAQGFTSELISARAEFFSGSRSVAEATATAESCIFLWSNAFAAAAVSERWQRLIDPSMLALIARSLASRGQFVALIDGSGSDLALTPFTDFDFRTVRGRVTAYRGVVPEAHGGHQVTALADEVVDIKIGADVIQPWFGQSPLRKARVSADLLSAIESGLAETFAGSWGNQVLASPELTEQQRDRIESRLKTSRGNIALVESTRSLAAGAPVPAHDWRPESLSPDLRGLEAPAHAEAVRNSIMNVFGVPAQIFAADGQSAAIRESQRHLVLFTLAPIARIAAAELGKKLNDSDFSIDLTTPLQAADSAGRARAVGILTGSGMSLEDALSLTGWYQDA